MNLDNINKRNTREWSMANENSKAEIPAEQAKRLLKKAHHAKAVEDAKNCDR